MICTHQSWWLSRTGNGIQDPESHDQDSARTSCEIPPCPVGNAGFTAPSSVWLFLGSQPSGRSCSWKCSAIWKSDAKMNSIHLATPCKTSGLNDLPRPTEQLLAEPRSAGHHSDGWTGTASRALLHSSQPSTPTANEAGTCRKQHPLLPQPPNSPWAPPSPIPGVAERMCDAQTAAWFACTTGAAGFCSEIP